MYTEKEKFKMISTMADAMEYWLDGFEEKPIIGEETTKLMAQAACNVLFAIADAQDWMKNNDMLKEEDQ